MDEVQAVPSKSCITCRAVTSITDDEGVDGSNGQDTETEIAADGEPDDFDEAEEHLEIAENDEEDEGEDDLSAEPASAWD